MAKAVPMGSVWLSQGQGRDRPADRPADTKTRSCRELTVLSQVVNTLGSRVMWCLPYLLPATFVDGRCHRQYENKGPCSNKTLFTKSSRRPGPGWPTCARASCTDCRLVHSPVQGVCTPKARKGRAVQRTGRRGPGPGAQAEGEDSARRGRPSS